MVLPSVCWGKAGVLKNSQNQSPAREGFSRNERKGQSQQPSGWEVGDGQRLALMQPPSGPDRVLTLCTS